jgi:signal transduction histidine kinase/FixJ family two-component response regulator
LSRILVVDDKEENLYLLRALLQGHGHLAILARNGAEALARAGEEAPDLVISDILMPVMDGFSLCRRWKGADSPFRQVPFVFYTATYTEPKDEQLALSLGADRFIVKPAEPARFIQMITEILEDHGTGRLRVPDRSPEPEAQYLREYSEVLVHKLEDKLVELERANRTLQEKDSFNLAVLDAMAALVAVLDPGGKIVAVNKAWKDFGSRPVRQRCSPLLGREIGENALEALEQDRAAKPEVALRLRNAVLEVLRGERPEYEVELPSDDPPRWFLFRVEHVGAPGAAAVIACSDVTELERAAAATKEASRRKDEFLAMLGHELRNPLAPIRTASYVLRRVHSHDPRTARATEIIDRQVGHLTRIVDDLLDVSRIVRGKLAIQREPTDWANVVQSTAEDYRAGFEARGLELSLELPGAPVWVRGDRTRLAQVVANLLANAQKFTERGGRVAVDVRVDERAGSCSLSVRDTGIGMTPEMLARVFQPFEQGPQTSARTRGGFGLGLTLVKGLVEMHEGEVSAWSEGPGRGSELRIRLPLGEAPAARAARAGPGPAAAGLHVLVIEDNQDAAESLRTVLEMGGFSVEVAHDGPSGVAAARARRPQVVLCDIGLPGAMDGYEVARTLRADPDLRSVRLIALTGYGQQEDVRRAEDAGFDSHVTKPADPQGLLGLVAVPAPADRHVQ